MTLNDFSARVAFVMYVICLMSMYLLVWALLIEMDTGHPARCAFERFWHGENEWVQTHNCGGPLR